MEKTDVQNVYHDVGHSQSLLGNLIPTTIFVRLVLRWSNVLVSLLFSISETRSAFKVQTSSQGRRPGIAPLHDTHNYEKAEDTRDNYHFYQNFTRSSPPGSGILLNCFNGGGQVGSFKTLALI